MMVSSQVCITFPLFILDLDLTSVKLACMTEEPAAMAQYYSPAVDLSGWNSHIFRDEKDIYRGDPKPDGDDDDDNVFPFDCL